jgi:RHS repeat-associated protein
MNGFLESVTNPDSHAYHITTNASGYVLTFQKPGGQTSQVTYDAFGYVTKDQGAGGDFISLLRQFNTVTSTQTVTSSTALNRITVYRTIASASGSTHSVTTPSGESKTSETPNLGSGAGSSSLGISTTSTTSADPRFGSLATYTSQATSAIPSSSVNIQQSTTKTANLSNPQDPLSVVSLNSTTILQGDVTRKFKTDYLASSRRITFTSPLNRTVKLTLNAKGKLASTQVGSQTAVKLTYDVRGRVNKATQGTRVWSFTYDAKGNVASQADPIGRITQFTYGSGNRVTKTTLPDGKFIKFSYDPNGNLTAITPPSKPIHKFGLNLMELISTYTPPSVANAGATTYSYNLDQQIKKITEPGNQIITFTYDTAGRLTKMVSPISTRNFTYLSNSDLVAQMSSTVGPTVQAAYVGDLLKSETSSGAVVSSLSYGFSVDGKISSMILAGNGALATTSFTYDKDGLLSKAGNHTLTRDSAGLVTKSAIGVLVKNNTYNTFGEVTKEQVLKGTTVQSTRSLVRDATGRITQETSVYKGVTAIQAYTYGTGGRLNKVLIGGTVARTYSYDSNGNRITYKQGAVTKTATYDAQDRLLTYGQNDYQYSPNGELIGKTIHNSDNSTQSVSYGYDGFGNLLSVNLPSKSIQYYIDGLGRRVGKRVNNVLTQAFIYSGSQVVGELNSSGALVKRYIYGEKSHVPDVMIYNGKQYKIITNQVGTPLRVVDSASGTVAEEFSFNEFGEDLLKKSTSLLPFGFAGGIYDRDTKLVHFGARDYDPETGRWLSKDPIRFDGGDTNLYGYVLQDPINKIDFDGLQSTPDPDPFEMLGEAVQLFKEDKRDRERIARENKREDSTFQNEEHGSCPVEGSIKIPSLRTCSPGQPVCTASQPPAKSILDVPSVRQILIEAIFGRK